MPVAVAGIAGFVGSVAAGVGAAAVAIGSAVAGIVTTVGAVIGSVVGAIGSAITGALGTVADVVGSVASAISTGVGNAISTISSAIGTVTEPILQPIVDGLSAIDKFVTGVETWVKTTFEPVVTTIELANKISGYFVLTRLLTGTGDITDKLDAIADKAGIETAATIAELSRNIVQTTTDVMDWTQDLFSAFDKKVIHADERIREMNDLAIAELRAAVDERFIKIRADLDFDVTRLDRDLVRIERRIEDLPWFTGMMIKALR